MIMYLGHDFCMEDQQLPLWQVSCVHDTDVIKEKGKGQYCLALVMLQQLPE